MRLTKGFTIFLLVMTFACVIGGVLWYANQPASPANTTAPSPSVPGQQPAQQPGTNPTAANGQPDQPGVVQPGTGKDCTGKTLRVLIDAYAGYYPVIYQALTIDNPAYCIEIVPAWASVNGEDLNKWPESERAEMLKNGEIDLYFLTNGAAALYPQDYAVPIAITSQSARADAIVGRKVGLAGQQILKFNEVQSITYSPGGSGHFMALAMMKTIYTTPNSITMVPSDSPVGCFNESCADAVSFYDPSIRAALNDGTQELITTGSWRIISDIILASPKADAEKKPAITAFLTDWYISTNAFLPENLSATTDVLASWTYQGQNMSSWLGIANDPVNDLKSLVEKIAFAKFINSYSAQEAISDLNYFDKMIVYTREVWGWGGQSTPNFNSRNWYNNEYLQALSNNQAVNVRGTFYQTFLDTLVTAAPAGDPAFLATLPVIAELPYREIKFVPGSTALIVGEADKVTALIQPMLTLINNSPDSFVVIQGGSAWPSGDSLKGISDFANLRARVIRDLLQMAGVPLNRIIIVDPLVPMAPQTIESERVPYRVVIVDIRSTSVLR